MSAGMLWRPSAHIQAFDLALRAGDRRYAADILAEASRLTVRIGENAPAAQDTLRHVGWWDRPGRQELKRRRGLTRRPAGDLLADSPRRDAARDVQDCRGHPHGLLLGESHGALVQAWIIHVPLVSRIASSVHLVPSWVRMPWTDTWISGRWGRLITW